MPRFDPQLSQEFGILLEHHRSQPGVTFAEHLASLEEDMAREVLGKVRVYLDLRYWIYLRDASLGTPQRDIHAQLLKVLISGVNKGNVICPITDSVFFELDRQGNTERRIQTVRLIDQLSRGAVIKNADERLHCEVIDFLEAATVRKEPVKHPCRNVWVRPYSFLGTPIITGWPEAEQLAINKAFISYMWTRSLEDLLTDTPVPDDDWDTRFRESAKRITESSARHEPDMRSFPQVFAAEVGGFVDLHRAVIFDAFQQHITTTFGASDGSTTAENCANVVYNVIKRKRAGIEFPLIRIVSGLHAFIRWNRKRSFEFQDFFDIYHAAAAIPYCDIFLTERFLKTACTSRLLNFANSFETQIISDEAEAFDTISRLVK